MRTSMISIGFHFQQDPQLWKPRALLWVTVKKTLGGLHGSHENEAHAFDCPEPRSINHLLLVEGTQPIDQSLVNGYLFLGM